MLRILLTTLLVLTFSITAVATITAVIHLVAPYAAFLTVLVFVLWLLAGWIRRSEEKGFLDRLMNEEFSNNKEDKPP